MELIVCIWENVIWENKLAAAVVLLVCYSFFHLLNEKQNSDFKSIFIWLMTGKEIEYQEPEQSKMKPGIFLLLRKTLFFISLLLSIIIIEFIAVSKKEEFLNLLGALYVAAAFLHIKYSEEAYDTIREYSTRLYKNADEKGLKYEDGRPAYAIYEVNIFGGEIYLLVIGGIIVGTVVLEVWEICTVNSMGGLIATWVTIFVGLHAIERRISPFRLKAASAANK